MKGGEVFKVAVRMFVDCTETMLTRHGFTAADVSLFVPHQANLRIIKATAERLGATLFMHPTDVVFPAICDGYNGALYNSLGKVVEVSIAAYRLVLSGIMERHPNLKIFMSHTGGALPYQAGRMDKNSKAAKLPKDPSVYLRRMYTDTVNPHGMGVRFALEFYGVDHVMYGSDYPCWQDRKSTRLNSSHRT